MRPILRSMLPACFLCFVSLASAQVWPGDINDNGEVNTVDILYWALSNDTDGPPRPGGSLIWTAQTIADPWPETFPDGQNFAYADCNGDGQIDLVDRIIIQLNQDSSHAPYFGEDLSTGVRGEDPLLWLGEAEDQVLQATPGSALSIPIHLGNADHPVEDFFGIAFRILIDTGFIGAVDPVIEKEAQDWLFAESALSTLNLDAPFAEAGRQGLEVALHLLDPNATTIGSGKIATLNFIIEDDLTLSIADTTIQVIIDPIRMINNQLSTLSVASDTLDIRIYRDSLLLLSSEVKPPKESVPSLSVFPNPAAEILNITLAEQEIASAAVYNTMRQLCLQKDFLPGSDKKRIDIQPLPPGPYWIRVVTSSGDIGQAAFIKIDTR